MGNQHLKLKDNDELVRMLSESKHEYEYTINEERKQVLTRLMRSIRKEMDRRRQSVARQSVANGRYSG